MDRLHSVSRTAKIIFPSPEHVKQRRAPPARPTQAPGPGRSPLHGAMIPRPLMTLRQMHYRTEAGLWLGPLTWTLGRHERILLEWETPAVLEALFDLLSGRLQPAGGSLEEEHRVRVQSDRHLRELLTPNRTIQDILRTAELPDTIWLEQRRRSRFVVLDRLGLSPHQFRRPFKLESRAVLDKFWAFRFIVSRAELLLGREVFLLEDPAIRQVLRQRWSDFPGTVVCAAPEEVLPGPVTTRAVLHDDGSVEARPAAPGPPPGA